MKTDELGEGAYKKAGGARQNTSLEQGMQASMATMKAATTTSRHHTEKISGDINIPQFLSKDLYNISVKKPTFSQVFNFTIFWKLGKSSPAKIGSNKVHVSTYRA